MSNCYDRFVMIEGEEDSFKTWQGLRGPYYTPSVSEDGTLSWTNNGDLQNPANVNIIGPPGEQGPAGDPGPGVAEGGTTGQLLAKSSDEDYDTEWIDQPEMDAGHVSYDSTEAYDDGTVGKELTTINSALTSLSSVTEIIDTASGAIASFPDGSGLPMRSLVAQIEPQQEGSGDPSPENVRPISGWTGLSGWVEDEYDPTEQPTFSVSWQTEAGTVYGGTVDVVSGVLTVTHRYVLLDGTQTINKHSTTAYNGFHLNLANNGLPACASTEDGTVGQFSYYKLGKLINANGNAFVGANTIQFRNDSLTTKDEAIAYLTANPLQVVYPLATPQTYQLTPQQISTLLGNNTVFVDTGDVSVTYQASIKGYIDKVLAS